MSRHLERLLRIDSLIRSRERHTAPSMAEVLRVSERTIRNDIAFLRDRFDAPLEYSTPQGWRYTDPHWRLPSIPITQGELFALTLGARMLEAYSGSVYQQLLQSAINCLAERLPQALTFDLQQLAQEQVNFRAGGEIQLDPQIWMQLLEASERSLSIWMRYYSPQRRQESERVLDPYVMDIYRATNPYVWGYCHERKEVRQFRIDRIRELKILNQTFERDPTFNLQEILEQGFQYEVGGQVYDVTIAFDPATAPYITERTWHRTQTVETHEDGSILLRFRAAGLNDIKRWVLGYGKGAIVREPPELRRMVTEEIEYMNYNYANSLEEHSNVSESEDL